MIEERDVADVFEELAGTIDQLTTEVGPAVVGVGRGSGVVIDAGKVLSNAHNVHDERVRVRFGPEHVVEGSVVGYDPDGDLAVVDVDTGDVTPVEWSDRRGRVGTAVFALANPRGRGVRTTFGTISAVDRAFRGPRGRVISDAIEHVAPLARGSSGGPLVDAGGRLVGVNTHRRGDGFYLAVSATDDLRRRVEALAGGESPRRARLGVAIAPPRMAAKMREAVGLEPRDGLLVRGVEPDGPAHGAGLDRGDLIVEAAGQPVATPDELSEILDAHDPSVTLTLKVVRGTDEHDLEVTFDG